MGKLLASQRFHLFHLALTVFFSYCETNGWSLFLFQQWNSNKQWNVAAAICIWSVVVCNFTIQNTEYVFKGDYYKIGPMAWKMSGMSERWGEKKREKRMAHTLFIRRIFYQFAIWIKNFFVWLPQKQMIWHTSAEILCI